MVIEIKIDFSPKELSNSQMLISMNYLKHVSHHKIPVVNLIIFYCLKEIQTKGTREVEVKSFLRLIWNFLIELHSVDSIFLFLQLCGGSELFNYFHPRTPALQPSPSFFLPFYRKDFPTGDKYLLFIDTFLVMIESRGNNSLLK